MDIMKHFFTNRVVRHWNNCPGKQWNHHHSRHLKGKWMWHLEMCYSGGFGYAGLAVGLDDLEDSFPT